MRISGGGNGPENSERCAIKTGCFNGEMVAAISSSMLSGISSLGVVFVSVCMFSSIRI